jgi:putative effector of murein hydrolase
MGEGLRDIWVYLAASPLLALTLTLAAYQMGFWIYRKGRLNPLLNPVLIAVVVLVAILIVTDTSYATYFEGAQFVHFLLGPATVALALPLYRQIERVRKSALAITVSLLAGSSRQSPVRSALRGPSARRMKSWCRWRRNR